MLGGKQNQPKMTRLGTYEKKGPNQVFKVFSNKVFEFMFFFNWMCHTLSPYNMFGMKMIINVLLYERT
jgi:hypothetical protein